ncbi:MAG: hypothetical protein JNK45_32355 [Myxococcales bacterium]|nr:hypothetical protein [Myxococcales bacterium]
MRRASSRSGHRAGGVAVLAVALLGGCLDGRAYPCATDLECRVDGVQGLCHGSGFCAYPDGRCPSELRYGPAAGDGLAFECVPPGGGEGNESNAFVATESSSGSITVSTTASTVTEGGSASASSGGCEACDAPPSDCFEPLGSCGEDGCVYPPRDAGVVCTLPDPCVIAAACDGAGTCLVTEGMPCDNPPGPCDSADGVCQKDGSCSYEPLEVGTPCDDGDDCTMGESCNAAGVCAGGEPCATDNPCETAACVGGQCQIEAVADGSSCGAAEADRCCDGECVDISSDEANCGGCGVACDSDDVCESVSATNTCELAPAATTGRCTCDAANADCPLGQLCRTVSPFANRCTPNGDGNCVNSFQDVNLCPNYCFYP